MPNLSDKLSSLQFTPKPQSPAFAGAVVNVPLAQVSKYQEKNYFLCDGSEYSETTYAELFAACGTQYNTGGETAGFFRVPNGPRQTKRVDLSSYFSSADNGGTLTEMYGFAEQKLDGKWYVTLWGQGTKTSNTTGTTLTFTSGTFNFEETTFPIGSYNVQNMLARTNAPDSIQTGTNPGNYGSWFISISDSPCTSAPSWADANLAFQPMIKVYDDASNISMSLADATATKTGAIRLDSSFAAGAGVYGLVKGTKSLTNVDQGSLANNTITNISTTITILAGTYLVYFGANYRVQSATIASGAHPDATLYITDSSDTILSQNSTPNYDNNVRLSRAVDGGTDQYAASHSKIETITLLANTDVKIRAKIDDRDGSASLREVYNAYMVWEPIS